ncbi:MAG: prepilin-type N-terminal cleavage/methylation domain-containing protein [Myxococcales bacterium]|nr:prepilin-type N-terminal cleavage/methylation domain-containing protein [Myxococcales bacterium]MDD9970328.1 prepilin-type N-terminal cleavage/methylation domain-containing protein [Myxococcales bacterium]
MTGARRQAGVTLIEVLVAMSIMAVLMTLMYSGFTQTANNKRRVEARLNRNHEIRMGLERMARELSMAYVSAQLNPNPALRPVITAFVGKPEGSGSRLDFTSFSHQRLYRDAHESDQNELSYYVTEDPEDGDYDVLVRRAQRRVDDKPQEGGTIQVMVEDVVSVEFSYLDPFTKEWTDTWDTTQAAMHPNRLPSQVKILLTVPNLRGRGPDQTFGTRVSLPITFAVNHAIY